MEYNATEKIIYGGAFDPPTLAHEAIIKACLELGPKELWLMPSGNRADKPGVSCDEDRLAMLGLVKRVSFGNDARLVVSDFELNLPRPSITHQTVKVLEKKHPAESFRYVFGVDSYYSMDSWQHGAELKRHMRILVVPRVGFDLPKEQERLHRLHVPGIVELAASSTLVRNRISARKSIAGLVSPVIAGYIGQNNLYSRPSNVK